jgi:hypothetical protein
MTLELLPFRLTCKCQVFLGQFFRFILYLDGATLMPIRSPTVAIFVS